MVRGATMNCKNGETRDKILSFLIKYRNENRMSPTYQEICDGVGLKNKASVAAYMKELEELGVVTVQGHRGIRINKKPQVPVVGSIACGIPSYAEQNIEDFDEIIKAELKGDDYFMLRASGESMTGVGIHDGDLVIIKRQNSARDGQIVVALIDDEATLKRIKIDKKNKKVILHPENPAFSDMEFDNVNIQGIAVKVLSNLV
ncbi:MAG: transcriptional repressor LexA [Bacteroidales bacterium]|nr:transcriptional repressor LexA [Bacteroidales bacterium]